MGNRRVVLKGRTLRIRLDDDIANKLFEEKNRTDKSVSQIVRQAVSEYFRLKRKQQNIREMVGWEELKYVGYKRLRKESKIHIR